MRLWLSLPPLPTKHLRDLALAAESIGIEGLAIPDHACVPQRLDSVYPYTGKRAVLATDAEFPEPMVLMSGLGSTTTRLRFMTYVLLLPLRHPVLLAKSVATAAAMTDGRVDLGVGVGWMREEFDALGIAFESRGSRTDEALALLPRLWAGEVVAHNGMHFQFEALSVSPAPPAPVALFIGGYAPAALRRAARFGDGWVGVNPTMEELAVILQRLRDERRQAGTEERPFEIRTGIKGTLERARLDELAALGVDAVVVMPWQVVPRGTPAEEVSVGMLAGGLDALTASMSAGTARPS